MSVFKVGDRVRVYGGTQTGQWKDLDRNPFRTVTVVGIVNGGQWINVEYNDRVVTVHHKQCRKLVKKVKREFYIRICMNDDQHEHVFTTASKPNCINCTHCEILHVREVKENK